MRGEDELEEPGRSKRRTSREEKEREFQQDWSPSLDHSRLKLREEEETNEVTSETHSGRSDSSSAALQSNEKINRERAVLIVSLKLLVCLVSFKSDQPRTR